MDKQVRVGVRLANFSSETPSQLQSLQNNTSSYTGVFVGACIHIIKG